MKWLKSCRVCGSPATVKSHLFPAALAHDIRRDEKYVIAVTPKGRERFLQSGEWSDGIVCRAHEDAFQTADDHAVTFCRAFEASATVMHPGLAVQVPNDRPDLLVRFAHAVVWRFAAAHTRLRRPLGPYMQIIEDVLFQNRDPLELVIVEPGHVLRKERTILGLSPTCVRIGPLRVVRFDIGGLAFILKTDQRPFPYPLSLFHAQADPMTVLMQDPVDIRHNPAFRIKGTPS